MVARETKTHTQLFFQKIDPMQFNGLLPARVELKKKTSRTVNKQPQSQKWKMNTKNFYGKFTLMTQILPF